MAIPGQGQPLGPDAKPIQDESGFLLPPYKTFAAIWNAISRTYRYTWDEAVKHSAKNALAMRRDCFLMACLRERQLPTAQRSWHLEPEDPDDQTQQEVADLLTDVITATKGFTRMRMNLLDAIWYGRYGSQLVWSQYPVRGEMRWCVRKHAPVNGDKIQFGFDGTPHVFVSSVARDQIPATDLVLGDRAPMLKLSDNYYRQRFVIHQHECDDADFFEGEMAGGIEGVGVRSRVYWAWWLRDECLSWALDYLEKVGMLGLLMFLFPEGNPQAKAEAEQAAREASNRSALAVPVPPGTNWEPVKLLQASPAGVSELRAIIADYFERHIERYIVGQSLSANANPTGLGSKVADLHADTKYNILKFDAANLDETLTNDFVAVAKQMNFPDADFTIYFRSQVPAPDAEEKLQAAAAVQQMGFPVDGKEVMEFAGLSPPDPEQLAQQMGDGLNRPDIAAAMNNRQAKNGQVSGTMTAQQDRGLNRPDLVTGGWAAGPVAPSGQQ